MIHHAALAGGGLVVEVTVGVFDPVQEAVVISCIFLALMLYFLAILALAVVAGVGRIDGCRLAGPCERACGDKHL